ncbi:extracellular solute-binding protein [Nonomuraea ceibae]|uniref:extracellular solute-binding protein n=1 Tax=Nonomuraea ceibae TaxID=1935170 RepID=UPI001C5E634E|nr:extracellular solute-binding protein [Nonomuraea ceibae]
MRPLAIALVAVLLAAGCSAQRRDKITVACGASERWCSMMVKRFSDATGVEADFVRLSSGEALARRGLKPVRSWTDLLDERLRGGVAIAHPATSGTAYTALWTQALLNGGDQDAALAYMRRLHPNVLRYNASGSAAAVQAAKEEAAVGIVFSPDCVAAREQGYPNLEVTFPQEGTGYELGGLAGAHNPAGARTYVDWALSGASQRLGPLVQFYALPTNTEVPAHSKAADPAAVKLVPCDVEAAEPPA